MQKIAIEDIINYKILPYNIYSEFGEKIFAAGEVLTPGKLLQLRKLNFLYKDAGNNTQNSENATLKNSENTTSTTTSTEATITKTNINDTEANSGENSDAKKMNNDISSLLFELTGKIPSPAQEEQDIIEPKQNKDIVVETFDMNAVGKAKKTKLTVDNVDILSYKGPINKKAKITPEIQIKIKAFYNKIQDMIEAQTPWRIIIDMLMNLRDKIVQDIIFESHDVYFCSQLKLLGEYNKCHALNTAILSGALAKKMELKEENIFDIVFAGLLHDIGKIRIEEELLNKTNLTHREQKIIESHTQIGYKIIKEEMDLPEKIARVALEHHENNDGSGYPFGKSGDWISKDSQIVNVCNYFDNVTSNRTSHKVKNIKDSMHVMLELGSKRFSAEELYTFVHMFNYNDTINFKEMIL